MTKLPDPLSEAQLHQFCDHGYLFVPGLFDDEETQMLITAAREDTLIRNKDFGVADREGKPVRLTVWNHPGDDIWGTVSRCNRIVGAAEQLLGGEVYHYHSKMILKEPKAGGAWEWHQDYGYWYKNGCLYPDLVSCMIALDKADRTNGCLQVLKGSHKLGRIEHGMYADQTCADPERTEQVEKRLERVYCKLDPGDGLFFHANLLHRSDANESDRPRWGLICCYNAAHNDPYKEHHHPRYTPLHKIPDGAVKQMGAKLSANRAAFLEPETDQTVRAKRD